MMRTVSGLRPPPPLPPPPPPPMCHGRSHAMVTTLIVIVAMTSRIAAFTTAPVLSRGIPCHLRESLRITTTTGVVTTLSFIGTSLQRPVPFPSVPSIDTHSVSSRSQKVMATMTCSTCHSSSSRDFSHHFSSPSSFSFVRRPLRWIASRVASLRWKPRAGNVRRILLPFLLLTTLLSTTVPGVLPSTYAATAAAPDRTHTLVASSASTTHKPGPDRHLDSIIDRYVRTYMWESETYDPVDSLYRELHHDVTTQEYPHQVRNILRDVGHGSLVTTTAALGEVVDDRGYVVDTTTTSSPLLHAYSVLQRWSRSMTQMDVGRWLTRTITAVQRRTGWSQSTAIAVVAAVLVASAPTVLLGGSMVVGSMSKRNMNKVFKQRYGESYSVDATAKREVTVEAPEEDEDDDDDDDDENDEDDNVDEDDDE